jgi:protoporphyrinogen oxidase
MTSRTSVIGAGISGLSAAYFLNGKAEIYEASHEPGGRVKAANIGNQWVDLGAQFIAKDDKHAMELVERLGMIKRLKAFDLKDFFFYKDGHKLDSKQLFKSIRTLFLFIRCMDEKKFTRVHEEIAQFTFLDWYQQEFGSETGWLVDSMCRPVTFASSKELSAIFGIAIVAGYMNDCYSFEGGVNEIVTMLIKKAKPKLTFGLKATWLELGKNNRITLETQGKSSEQKTQGKILSTIPAPELAKIVGEKDLRRALNKIEYAGCGVVVFETDEKIFGEKLGVIFQGAEVAAAYDITSRFRGKTDLTEAIVALVPFRSENKLDYQKLALKSLSEFDPDFKSKIKSTTIVEWKLGLPICSPKLFEIQERIREASPENLLIAGDFMGLPSLDASIETAYTCAKKLG